MTMANERVSSSLFSGKKDPMMSLARRARMARVVEQVRREEAVHSLMWIFHNLADINALPLSLLSL